jgi:ubiquinone/menaquinone biosynthesis C-methylase UbiE
LTHKDNRKEKPDYVIMEMDKYVHGYSGKEASRLNNQADTLEDIIHCDSIFPDGSLVLEAGCGVGAQTKIITAKNPHSRFISIDISEDSIREATEMQKQAGLTNVEFKQADIFNFPFEDEAFDAVILCFVLEHLHDPIGALQSVKRVLKKGGVLMAIEGDHGSTFFYPESEYAHSAINCQIQLQKQAGGNANIGRALYPLFSATGLKEISVTPRMVYVDSSKPQLVEGFIKNTFTAMIEGVGKMSVERGLIDDLTFDKGIQDLYRTAASDGVFCYTFFKGVGIK